MRPLFMRAMVSTAVVFAVLTLAAGCQAKPSLAPQKSKTIEAPAKTAVEPEKPKGPMTADEIVAAFKAASLPIGKVEVYDAENDSNELLGRPGQYTAKFNFADTRLDQPSEDVVGGSIESFENEKDLGNRAEYIKSIGESVPAFAEYQYTSGLMLLRLDKGLTPDQAEAYNKIFQTLGK